MNKYELILNEAQRDLLDYAIDFCIDSQRKMGAITPRMALGLIAIQGQISIKKSQLRLKEVPNNDDQNGSS